MSNENEGFIINGAGEEVEEKAFRVHRVLDPTIDPVWGSYNFAHLGFRNEGASYSRGRKHYSVHLCAHSDEKIVERFFYDVWEETNTRLSIRIVFNFYLEDGTIGGSKDVIVKRYNKFKTETILRNRRERQFDYLNASARNTPLEPYINTLMHHYGTEISEYKQYGSLELETKMQNETNAAILGVLNQVPVPRNDGQGMTTIKKSIQYQIGTITLEQL